MSTSTLPRKGAKVLSQILLAFTCALFMGTVSAFAAANDYTVSGGTASGALPAVGATSAALGTVTITDVGGDDFTSEPENLIIAINTSAFPSVVFDTSIAAGTLTIAGTCSFNGANALTYNASATTVTIPLTGPGAPETCANTETITILGLKVGTIYSASAPGAAALITVDNSTTALGSAVSSSSTSNAAIATGALSTLSMTPDTYANSTLSTYTVAFTTTAVSGSNSIPNNGNLQVTFPTGYDLAGVSGNAQSLSGLDGTWAISVSGQVVTLTQSGGTASAAGAKSFTIANVRNPSAEGATSTFTVTSRTSSTAVQTGAPAALTISAGSGTASEFNDVENLAVADYEDGGVKLTWDDPTDDDTTYIQILKGTDPFPVNGTVYATVAAGVEYYIDTDVDVGDTVTYQLRPTDGSDTGSLTKEVSFVVGSGTTSTDDSSTEDTDDSTDDTDETNDSIDTDDTEEDETDDSTTADDTSTTVSFTDELPSWAETAIEVMAGAGVVEGNPDGTFEPSEDLNRAEASTLLWRVLMMGDASEATSDPFDDVDMGEWYAPYIAGLKALVLVEGNPDGTFEPGESINRAEFLQMAVNVYLYLNPDKETEMDTLNETMTTLYSDVDEGTWYANTVDAATDWGFIEGSTCDEGRCFNPGEEITRAEATKILYNMFADWVQQ